MRMGHPSIQVGAEADLSNWRLIYAVLTPLQIFLTPCSSTSYPAPLLRTYFLNPALLPPDIYPMVTIRAKRPRHARLVPHAP